MNVLPEEMPRAAQKAKQVRGVGLFVNGTAWSCEELVGCCRCVSAMSRPLLRWIAQWHAQLQALHCLLPGRWAWARLHPCVIAQRWRCRAAKNRDDQ